MRAYTTLIVTLAMFANASGSTTTSTRPHERFSRRGSFTSSNPLGNRHSSGRRSSIAPSSVVSRSTEANSDALRDTSLSTKRRSFKRAPSSKSKIASHRAIKRRALSVDAPRFRDNRVANDTERPPHQVLAESSNEGARACLPLTTLRASSGALSDGPGEYRANAGCVWIINAPGPITLTFLSVDLEADYDFVKVYSGPPSHGATLLKTLTGVRYNLHESIEAPSGHLYVVFTADALKGPALQPHTPQPT